MNPSTPHSHTMNTRTLRDPADLSETSTSTTHVPSGSPRPNRRNPPVNNGTSPLPIARATICAEALLAKMDGLLSAQDRITGSYEGTWHPRGRPDTFNPRCTHVPWHVLSVLIHECRPTHSIHLRPYHHPLCVSLWCKIRIECVRNAPVHIFPKGSLRRTCRNSTSESRTLSEHLPRERKRNNF